ncbi:uncharacterized protein IL334_001439 [Kwoniella shivajii]|uniref:Uncharacterized protein n=1 Tax=Kwoniella shivajii TaxID=564305 RepID=A0ABZ1CRW7_9TREE|nr:hypothetical protein IL334_001439 [Kwoniella shivajii]
MPNSPSFFSRRPRAPPPPPVTTFYLSSPSPSTSSLRPIPPPSSPSAIPSHTLIFSLTHPHPSSSQATSFFLDCIPDPIGFLYHSSSFISKRLSLSNSDQIEWRHQLIQLELEDKDGLAATSGGKIAVSLKWVERIMHEVQRGSKNVQSAIKEFKGVLLHELVHTIQHDGFGSTPGWLIESIADYVRLLASLGPEHWRGSGSGKTDKGWEEGYDIGARFLEWLTGLHQPPSVPQDRTRVEGSGSIPTQMVPTPTKINIDQPRESQYPNPTYKEQTPMPPTKPKERPGPFPDLVRLIDARLRYEKWEDEWWVEMTGLSLEGLWNQYMKYYGRS